MRSITLLHRPTLVFPRRILSGVSVAGRSPSSLSRSMSTIGELADARDGSDTSANNLDPEAILKEEEEFTFGCTGCGACCYSNVENISLTSLDLFNISRSPWISFIKDAPFQRGKPSDANSTRRYLKTDELRKFFPSAFRIGIVNLGQFADQTAHGIHCSLYPREVDGEEGACHFAYPLIPSTPGEDPTFVGESRHWSFEEFAQRDDDRSHERLVDSRIVCGLGRNHRPFACSMYPLQQQTVHEYHVDAPNCEGVTHPDAPSIRVSDYLKDIGAESRGEVTQWFSDIQSDLCYYQFYESFTAFRERGGAWDAYVGDSLISSFYDVVEGVLYDFDAIKCAPKDGFSSWEDASKAIRDGVNLIIEHGKKMDVSSTLSASESLNAFVDTMDEYGLTRAGKKLKRLE